MTMQLSNQFEKQRQAFLDAVSNGAPQEEQAKLYNDMIESMTNEMMAQARDAAREEVSALNPYDAKLTAEAREFFNDIDKAAPKGVEKLFPQETIDRIFEDMVMARPIRQHIVLKTIAQCTLFIADYARNEPHNGICHHRSSQLTAREHIVADADFTRDKMFADAIVNAFIMSAKHDKVTFQRKVVGYMLVERFAIGRGKNHFIIVTFRL